MLAAMRRRTICDEDDHALLSEGGLGPFASHTLELVADPSHRRDDGGVVGCTDRSS